MDLLLEYMDIDVLSVYEEQCYICYHTTKFALHFVQIYLLFNLPWWVIFTVEGYLLPIVAEDMTSPNAKEGMHPAGSNSILPKEHGSKFYLLPVVKTSDKDVNNHVCYRGCSCVLLLNSLWHITCIHFIDYHDVVCHYHLVCCQKQKSFFFQRNYFV